MDEYLRIVKDYNCLHTAQMAAVLQGLGFAYEQEIAIVREQREQAKAAILAHVDCTECSHAGLDLVPNRGHQTDQRRSFAP